MGRTRSGWKQLSTRTPDRALAKNIEAMWETLAVEHRAWDVLAPVLHKQLQIGELYDRYREAGRDVVELRRRLHDVDLEPIVAVFLPVHKPKVREDSLEHIKFHLRVLLPEKKPFPHSSATVETLTTKLYAYPGKPGTLRKVHSDWSVSFAYCANVRGLFERNRVEKVERPPTSKPLGAMSLNSSNASWRGSPPPSAKRSSRCSTGLESRFLSRSRSSEPM